MKTRVLLLFFVCIAVKANAQYRFTTTMQTSASNEYVQLTTFILEGLVNELTEQEKYNFAPQLVFPFSMKNSAPYDYEIMRGGYARAFSAPWKHLGDYCIGISSAWDHYNNPFGFYVGLDYKSKEVVFRNENRNDRAHYISPEAGLRFKFGNNRGLFLKVGASYDYVLKYNGGQHNYEKNAVNSGISLNIGIGHWWNERSYLVNLTLPTYNFYNKDFTPDNGMSHPFKDVNRNIGYISLIFR